MKMFVPIYAFSRASYSIFMCDIDQCGINLIMTFDTSLQAGVHHRHLLILSGVCLPSGCPIVSQKAACFYNEQLQSA